MSEHLHKPIENLHEGSSLAMNYNVSSLDELNCRSYDEQGDHQIIQKFKEDEIKWMYNAIYGIVLPKWENYLRLKSERSVETQIKARQDTLWKKIFRDVREFFRILFRLRFNYLEFKDSKGATIWIQKKFFDELGIPITEKEACDNKLFRFVHQTHKIKSTDNGDIEQSPFESIEKFNEIYKRWFMTNFTWARMFCFVFQSFVKEYSVYIKSRHKKDVLTMIWMTLNWYKRMSSCHHIKRIWGCIIRYDITQKFL